MAKFDSKTFNEEAFGQYVDLIPKTKKNELIKSRALRGNSQIKKAFEGQTGVVYATLPMYGRLGNDAPHNYDGKTDITAQSTTTFDRSVVVIGRAQSWVEKDFSEDVTGGADFMGNVAQQVSDYWEDVDQDTLLSILKGIFSMSGNAGNDKFVETHTYETNQKVGATTLNNATQKAAGDNKGMFTFIIMHSEVANTLENLQVLEYFKYTDENGVERKLSLANWNGRTVLIDDSMPTQEVLVPEHYIKTDRLSARGLEVVADDASEITDDQITVTETKMTDVIPGDYVRRIPEATKTQYTSYVLGEGAFDHENVGVEVPFEMDRDPAKNGGQDTLFSRQRKVFAPYGISFTRKHMVENSPTREELENGKNWTVVNNGESGDKRQYIDLKAIPIIQMKTIE